MVDTNLQQIGQGVVEELQQQDIRALSIIALTVTGGVVLAQELADRILPVLRMPREPTSATEFLTSTGAKGLVAIGLGFIATNVVTAGLGFVAAALAAIGALGSAGADFINALQRTGLAAEAPRQGDGDVDGSVDPETGPDAAAGAAADVTV